MDGLCTVLLSIVDPSVYIFSRQFREASWSEVILRCQCDTQRRGDNNIGTTSQQLRRQVVEHVALTDGHYCLEGLLL